PFIRIFFHKNKYITQDIRTDKTKWYTGKMSNVLEYFSFYGYNNTDTLYASDKTLRKAELFFNVNVGEFKSGKELYKAIRIFQNNILHEKLIEKHSKEFEEIDSYMKQLRKLPKNFNKWIMDTALQFSRYIIYDYNKNSRYFKAYCTHCGKDMMIDSRNLKIRNNKNGKCPLCQNSITYKARKKFPQVKIDSVWCSILQKTKDNKFVLRTFKADKIYCGRGEKENYRIIVAELCRTFYYKDKYKCFENYYVPNLHYDGWYYDGNKYCCAKSVLYEKNINLLIKGTPYQYSALDLIVKDNFGMPFEYLMYLYQFRKNPYWEYLVKLRLYRLLRSLMWDWYFYRDNVSVNKEAKSIIDILKITKKEFAFLKEFNGDSSLLYLLQKICRINKNFSFDEMKLIWDYYKKDIDLLSACKYAPVVRIADFLEKQYEIVLNKRSDNADTDSNGILKAIFNDWNEYLGWCDKLGYKLKGGRILFPPVFYTAHDIVSNKYADYLRRKNKVRNKEIHFKLMDVLKEDKEYTFEYNDLALVVPDSEGVFKKESRLLKHCVKTYITKVAEGRTKIFFIRRKDDMRTPYYTLEYQNGHVIQCRGYKNCPTNDEIEEFVSKFLYHAREIENKKEKRKQECQY
ncbi:MAG: PcfJ domain-containing protein, partial [Firmicutes bacterium]|nr:PcfJ domain-containing protein [Bacillota bacterium]